MILNIPIKPNAAAWSQRQILDGASYVLDFAWSGRAGAWYLSISDVDGNALLLSKKIVSNRPLLNRTRFIPELPPGQLIALEPTGLISYAGYDDLGKTVELLYFDAAELAT